MIAKECRNRSLRLRAYTSIGRTCMKWVKPKFEYIDLCTEVTLYLYNRR